MSKWLNRCRQIFNVIQSEKKLNAQLH